MALNTTCVVVAEAAGFIDGDETATPRVLSVITLRGQLWLVLSWLKDLETDTVIPQYITPLLKFDHVSLYPDLFQLGRLLPPQLFSDPIPPSLIQEFEIEVYPSVLGQTDGNQGAGYSH